MPEVHTFRLGHRARVDVALHILKSALNPFVPDRVRREGKDPFEVLQPSNPIRKHGFDIDVRGILSILHTHAALFGKPEHIKPACQKLQKLRDLWAHQQALTARDVNECFLQGAALLETLNRHTEARCLEHLQSPQDSFLLSEIQWYLTNAEQASLNALIDHLGWPDQPDEIDTPLMASLLHLAAYQWTVTGGSTIPELSINGSSLPSPIFYWVAGLSADSPDDEVRRASFTTETN